ncbi:MAG TPA: hypothetical protein VGB50_04715 [Flavobacterium sp.]|jgi:GNAT superfamily N-acetyltransferase
MPQNNYYRLIKLAEEVFDAKHDPEQLDVNQEVLNRLSEIHPASVSEYNDENGPVAWVLVFPTTGNLMETFLQNKISEKELFLSTPADAEYDAIYLCSALVLEEYRQKGITKRLASEAISEIRTQHPIKALFVWAFTKEGDLASETIAATVSLPLFKRSESHQ